MFRFLFLFPFLILLGCSMEVFKDDEDYEEEKQSRVVITPTEEQKARHRKSAM